MIGFQGAGDFGFPQRLKMPVSFGPISYTVLSLRSLSISRILSCLRRILLLSSIETARVQHGYISILGWQC